MRIKSVVLAVSLLAMSLLVHAQSDTLLIEQWNTALRPSIAGQPVGPFDPQDIPVAEQFIQESIDYFRQQVSDHTTINADFQARWAELLVYATANELGAEWDSIGDAIDAHMAQILALDQETDNILFELDAIMWIIDWGEPWELEGAYGELEGLHLQCIGMIETLIIDDTNLGIELRGLWDKHNVTENQLQTMEEERWQEFNEWLEELWWNVLSPPV